MANEEESEVSSPNSSQFTFNELQDAFDELICEFKKMGIKNNFLKKMISTLANEKEVLQKEKDTLKNEVCILKEHLKKNTLSNKITPSKEEFDERTALKEKVKDLEISLFRCVNGKEKLDAILGRQKYSIDKAGISFNPLKRKKISKTKFVSSTRKSQISCFYCHKT